MFNSFTKILLLLSMGFQFFLPLFATEQSSENFVPVLNQNFEYDLIPFESGKTDFVTGWVNSGFGAVGVYVPASKDDHYSSIAHQGQVAFLDSVGRINQATDFPLIEGETYTLTFDTGWRKDQISQHFVARIKADGLVLAQIHSDDLAITKGEWSTESFSFVADYHMPLGKKVVVEFQNLAAVPGFQVNIDNVKLSVANTGFYKHPQSRLGKVVLITEDTLLEVPEAFSDINTALSHLNDKRIMSGVTVTVKVNDCSDQIYNESINIYHPSASSINIIGNTESPESCVLQFNGIDGVVADGKNILGKIDGFTIQGDLTPGTAGLHSTYSSTITTGDSLIVRNFERGLLAEHDASIVSNGITVEDNTDIGVYAYSGGYISVDNAISRNNGAGFVAEGASVIDANDSEAYTNTGNGFASFYNSTLIANNSISQSNLDNGYRTHGMSIIEAIGATATNNTNNGFYATDMSFQDIKDSTNSGNGSSHSPAINTTDGNYRSTLKK